MEKPGKEFIGRSGHRFNHIIMSLPTAESSAIPMNTLLEKAQKIGYDESADQLSIDVEALVKRKEVALAFSDGTARYWALPKGQMELRKRRLLIRLHSMELDDSDIAALEKIANKTK